MVKSKTIIFPAVGKAEIVTRDVPQPKPDEILAKTLVNGICMWEVHCFNKGVEPAFMPGHEGIGVVEAVGADVTGIKPGDYITTLEWSEYTLQKQNDVIKLSTVPKDPGLCMLEPLACAANALAHTPLYPGDRVFMSGCGYMGLLLLKLLSGYPLSNITVSDLKEENLVLAKRFGADETVLAGDSAKMNALPKDSFNVTFECSGAPAGLDVCSGLAARGGTLGLYSWHHGTRVVNTDDWHEKGMRVLNLTPGITANERRFRSFQAAEALTSSGKFSQSGLITHRYSVEDAQKAMEQSAKRGEGFIKSIFEF